MWRHNGHGGVSNQQPHDCLLNRLFRRRWKKYQSSASLAFVPGIHRWPVNSPHKWPVTRKMFPFDDVTMGFLEISTNVRPKDVLRVPLPIGMSFVSISYAVIWGQPEKVIVLAQKTVWSKRDIYHYLIYVLPICYGQYISYTRGHHTWQLQARSEESQGTGGFQTERASNTDLWYLVCC